jgi:hypothetical protein
MCDRFGHFVMASFFLYFSKVKEGERYGSQKRRNIILGGKKIYHITKLTVGVTE